MSPPSPSYPLLTGLSSIRKAPKWSMNGRGPSSLVNSEANKIPGPGAYASEKASGADGRYLTSPRFVFGTASRDQLSRKKAETVIPGPGAYTPRNSEGSSAAQYAFGRATRTSIVDKKTDSPGPGSYSVTRSLGGPSYSTGSKPDDSRFPRWPEPGPGHYSSVSSCTVSGHEAAPSWGFGTSRRPPIGSSVASARRSGADSARGPGPGSYEVGTSIGPKTSYGSTAPQFTIRQRRRSVKKDPSPGPGVYGGAYTQFGY